MAGKLDRDMIMPTGVIISSSGVPLAEKTLNEILNQKGYALRGVKNETRQQALSVLQNAIEEVELLISKETKK